MHALLSAGPRMEMYAVDRQPYLRAQTYTFKKGKKKLKAAGMSMSEKVFKL